MTRTDTKARLARDNEVHAAVRAAKASGQTARLRKAALELLSAIHEKMAGVTEEEVLATLEVDKKEGRRKASMRQRRAGERSGRRSASA
ncbi:MAG: hypothetical protein ACYDEB_14290 [Dehalococcoidia bacterium]